MYLIKGYNVSDKSGNCFRQIRFSGFSNLIINYKTELKPFRDQLSKKVLEETSIPNDISFVMFTIPGQSKDAKVLRGYLAGKSTNLIAQELSLEEEAVVNSLETYIHGTKI